MFERINFAKTAGAIPFKRLGKNNVLPSIKNDEFVKSTKKEDDEMQKKRLVTDVLSQYDFGIILRKLQDSGHYIFSQGVVVIDEDNIVRMGVEDFSTLKTEQYSFTAEEFLEILNDIKTSQTNDDKEKECEYNKLLLEFSEKLKQNEKG